MSFASAAREEIASIRLEHDCCVRAEAAGMLHAGGVITILGGGGSDVVIECEQARIARRAYALIKRGFGIQPELRTRLKRRLHRPNSFVVRLSGDDAEAVLSAVGLASLGLEAHLPPGLIDRSCCRRAFARGAFLMCGTIAYPTKGYHLEWRLTRESCAGIVCDALSLEGIDAKIVARRENVVVYIKEASMISDALALMGAVEALLELENVRVVKGIRNLVNRQVNCENANVDRAMAAAYRQIDAIQTIEKHGAFAKLPKALREIAEVRMEHPDATLEELGEMLKTPVGKSAVNHRLRRLQAIAQEMIEKDGGES